MQTGTGTVGFAKAPIRASGNVSSVTRNGTGDYTLNFSTAMPDANYAVTGCGQYDTGNVNENVPVVGIRRISGNPATGSVRVTAIVPSTIAGYDCLQVHVAIFR